MELWDVYDEERRLTGRTAVRGEKLGKGEYHLVVHVCIFNSEGKMLIQQRQSCKRSYPNAWDISCGGCATAGEDSRMAAHRELYEELGLDVDFSKLRPHMTVNFKNGFDDFYIINRDVSLTRLTLQPEEVRDARWADRKEIFAMIDDGSFIPFFPSVIELLFDIRHKPDCLNI